MNTPFDSTNFSMLSEIYRLINELYILLNKDPISPRKGRFDNKLSLSELQQETDYSCNFGTMEFSQRFKIVNKLGTQAHRKFGSIYLVEDTATGKKGVLKAVGKSKENSIVLERLKHEASFHFDRIGLPQVLATYDSETEFMMVRNFVEAEPLDLVWNGVRKRDRHGFLVAVLEQLIPLLNHLRDMGIVHCDLKPGNILVDTDRNVHLIDFGLSLRQATPDERTILFPLGFAAPELLLNRLHLVDHRTDYFALGIVLWRLYAGKLPLTHPNPSIFTNLQLTHPLPECSDVPRKVQKVLEKLSAKYAFKIPPNRLPQTEVDDSLRNGMAMRYDSLELFLDDFRSARTSNWFTR